MLKRLSPGFTFEGVGMGDIAVDLLTAYLGSNSHVTKTLIELGASPQQFESVQAAFSVATIVGLSAGSHDPEHLSKRRQEGEYRS